jgi:kinesin family member 11
LHTSYSTLGKDFKSIFEELLGHVAAQKSESDGLRRQIEEAADAAVQSNVAVSARIQEIVEEERRQAAEDRRRLLSQISGLINAQAEIQESRLAAKAGLIQASVSDVNDTLEGKVASYSQGMVRLGEAGDRFVDEATKSRDVLKKKLKDEWTVSAYASDDGDDANTRHRPPTSTAHRFRTPQSRCTPRLCVSSMNKSRIWILRCMTSTIL